MRCAKLLAALCLAPAAAYAGPIGIFSSGGPTNAVNNSVDSRLDNLSYVDGALVRIAWKDIETSPGVYNWSRLDTQFDRANQYGLKVSLGVVNGFNAPTWLSSQGVSYFSYNFRGSPVSMPVPWDTTFLNRWSQFVNALGARYGSNASLELVHITTSTSNGFEMQLPSSPTDLTNWTAAGYTIQKHVDAYKRVIDAFNQAFPNKPLDLEVHPVLNSDSVAQQATAYANSTIGDRFGVFAAWWSQHNADSVYPGMYQLVQSQAQQTFATVQLVTNATNDNSSFGTGGIDEALSRAQSLGIRYVEPWDTDLLNASFASLFGSVHYELNPTPGDVDMDHDVDFDDLLTLAQHYGNTGGVMWADGDFDQDHAVSFDDLLLLAQHYGGSTLAYGASGQFAADWTLARTLAPEPVSLLALPFCLLSIRRSR